jgi:uncharacterized glyoxalase superfamily protein PhnB
MVPALRCSNARAEIDFLVRAFGFENDGEHVAPDGSIAHAQLHLGAGVVGVSSAQNTPSEHPWSTVRQGIYVHVRDVDAHHDRAKAAGADIVMPLTDMDYGSREYSARDLDGHLWGFGTYDMAGNHAGEPNIFTGLHYHDTRAALAWLARAFGFEKTLEIPAPDGSVMHAEMRCGAGTILLGSAPKDTKVWGENTLHLYVYLPDPDAHFARAKTAGARIIQPVETTSYGARGYFAHDPEGFLWGFSTYRPATVAQP